MKNGNRIIWILCIAIVALLLISVRMAPKKKIGGPVTCLDPKKPLTQHKHAMLQIVINGVPATLPKDIGITPDCEKMLHTHDTTGTVHVEAQNARAYTLGDFFAVWGKPLVTQNFLRMTVDGSEMKGDPSGLVLAEGQQIVLYYKTPDGQ